MMKAAVDAAEGAPSDPEEGRQMGRPTILAITALTSLGQGDLLAIYGTPDPEEATIKLANIAYEAGARGFVCSPKEVAALKPAQLAEILQVSVEKAQEIRKAAREVAEGGE